MKWMRAPLLSVLAGVTVCLSPAAVMGADDPPPAPPAVTDTGSASKPPMIVRNPDGTLTVQKRSSNGQTEETGTKGLVIPPQVIVPTIPPEPHQAGTLS